MNETGDEPAGRLGRLGRLSPARLPIGAWLPTYDRSKLGADVLAGTVVAALVVPQALGYAGIAGVPVQVGLYAVPLALVAYAVLGTSRQLIVGPVSTVSVVSGSLIATQAAGDADLAVRLTAALAIASGLILVLAGLLRLGWSAEFLSKPIVTGFVFGLTIVIIVGELPSMLGIPQQAGNVFQRLAGMVPHLDDVQPETVAVSAVALLVLFGGSRLAPRVPWGLLVLVAGIAVSRSADLPGLGVRPVGDVPAGLPPLTLPSIPVDAIPGVLFGGAGLALVGLAEGLSAARLFAQRGGYTVDSNQELVAAGAANLGAGLSGGLGVAGSLSKTAAVERSGGGSQVAGLATAVIVVVALVAFVGELSPLPRAVLSAIVVHAVWGLMDVEAIRRYAHIRRNDFVGAMAALGGVLLFGTLYGLLAAIGQSVLGLVYRSSRVDVDVMGKVHGEKAAWGSTQRHPERRTVDGVLVLRLDAPVFWVNAPDVRDRVLAAVDAAPGTHAVILDLESTNQLDATSADVLTALLDDLRARGIDLYLVRVFHFVRRVLRRSGFEEQLGPGHMWHSISQGVREAKAARGTVLVAEHEEFPDDFPGLPPALLPEVPRAELPEATEAHETIAVDHEHSDSAEPGPEDVPRPPKQRKDKKRKSRAG
ncbi:MAG: SulP family inorganic anion transporter [Actinomycetia bacterium]|jgi:high affinity sulfate transporter 1|nr:SulP family inorganic anion transporter [Actinomycetes bacterium]